MSENYPVNPTATVGCEAPAAGANAGVHRLCGTLVW